MIGVQVDARDTSESNKDATEERILEVEEISLSQTGELKVGFSHAILDLPFTKHEGSSAGRRIAEEVDI